jgi:hypothetical protein
MGLLFGGASDNKNAQPPFIVARGGRQWFSKSNPLCPLRPLRQSFATVSRADNIRS